jgi:hypothetical protein
MFKSLLLISTLLLPGLALAADNKIPAGYDTWETVGHGLTFMSFADEPIPADFFCEGCEAFSGRIDFEGVPLATNPPGLFARTDTVIERLDDAEFKGDVAFARIRVKAMHLRAEQLLTNRAGTWDVHVGLAEEQPITTIDFNKRDENTGTFNAELVLNVRLTFINQNDPTAVRALERTVHFTDFDQTPYSLLKEPELEGPTWIGKRARSEVFSFEVDTDGDGLPDSPMEFSFESLQYLTTNLDFEQTNYTFDELLSHVDPTHIHSNKSTQITGDKGKLAGLSAGVDHTNREIGPLDEQAGELDPVVLLRKIQDLERRGMLTQPAEQILADVLEDMR